MTPATSGFVSSKHQVRTSKSRAYDAWHVGSPTAWPNVIDKAKPFTNLVPPRSGKREPARSMRVLGGMAVPFTDLGSRVHSTATVFVADGALLVGWALSVFCFEVNSSPPRDPPQAILPSAPIAWVDCYDSDRDYISIHIVSPESSCLETWIRLGTFDPGLLPIYIQGQQIPNLTHLRAYLRKLGDPTVYPDKEEEHVIEARYPSYRRLRIHCDYRQDFAWVHAIFALCGVLTDESPEHASHFSPLIYKMEFAVRDQAWRGW